MALVDTTLTYLDSEDATVVFDGMWQNNPGQYPDPGNPTIASTPNGLAINTLDESGGVVSALWLPWGRVLSFECDGLATGL